MNEIYFEAEGEALLKKIGMSKAEFARRMGIQRQNVKALFRSKDLRVIHRASEVLDVPWEMLVGYVSNENVAVGASAFGNVYDGFEGRPHEAFWFLVNHQEGDLLNVFSRLEIGGIDLVWGDENCGVRHILMKHINERDFPTVDDMISRVSSVINEGSIEYDNSDKVMLRKDGYVAVVRKNYRINGKKLETKNWVLTAYHKEII